jgi:serine/threonine protein kinase
MVFEYVERRSLMELPTENPLNEHIAWKYFRDTLKGLEYREFATGTGSPSIIIPSISSIENLHFFSSLSEDCASRSQGIHR